MSYPCNSSPTDVALREDARADAPAPRSHLGTEFAKPP
ncbi:hypothetical protein ABH933_005576 [Nocardia sp. GP40]